MKIEYKENKFKKFLVETLNLNKDFLTNHCRSGMGEKSRHLRIKPGSGIESASDFEKKLRKLKLPFIKPIGSVYSGTPDYYMENQFTVEWNGLKIGCLVAIQKDGGIRRKKLSPNNLNLDSSYVSAQKFYQDISKSLENESEKKLLISMLDNIKDKLPIVGLDIIKKEHIGRITSDFGEVLVAFNELINKKHWRFSEKKNSKVIDGYSDGKPVSVKNEKGGGKVNLVNYKDLIDQSTLTGKFLFALANHKKEDAIKIGVNLDSELQKLIPDPSEEGLKKLINKISYDDFYAQISSNKYFKGLGIPKPQDNQRAKELWNQKDLNPIYFTILTLICRLWGESKQGIREISSVVRQFLIKPKFVKVEIQGLNISITEKKFNAVKDWKMEYHSRSTAAWHNYPGVEPLEGI